MNTHLLFAIGTLLTWVGWAAVARALYLGLMIAFKVPALNVAKAQRGLLVAGVIAGVGLLVANVLPMQPAAKVPEGIRLPLVWFVMPFFAWGGVVSLAMVASRLIQGWLALNHEERTARLRAAGIWAGVAVLFAFLYFRDPANKVEILTGGIPLTLQTVVAVAVLAVASMVGMVFAAQSVRTRGYSKAVATHAALIAGSIVFGLPFAWLVITSFKEDRDMVAKDGKIVWVPRVQMQVDYNDPKDPLYEGRFQGRTVQASVITTLPNGNLQLDILKPAALRGLSFEAPKTNLKEVPKQIPVVEGKLKDLAFRGKVIEELEDGSRRVQFMEPPDLAGKIQVFKPEEVAAVRPTGPRVQNYTDALEFLPPETNMGLVYLKNTLILVVMGVVGTILSCSVVAYAFSRLRFPGKNFLFAILLSTMMLPGAVTLMPQFLIFTGLGWIDTLYPLWVPAFFAGAFNVFLLRQFFMQIPMELEDASKIDGAGYLRTFWSVMMPQIKPALAVIAIWTFMGAWNNFMGPLIYINSPENMPIAYAVQLFQGDRSGEPGLLMAFATMAMLPVLALFFFAQKYFIEGVTLSGLGGR